MSHCGVPCHAFPSCPCGVRLEAKRTGLAEFVVSALLDAGLEPPLRERVDRVGYGAAEVRAIVKALSSPEPT